MPSSCACKFVNFLAAVVPDSESHLPTAQTAETSQIVNCKFNHLVFHFHGHVTWVAMTKFDQIQIQIEK